MHDQADQLRKLVRQAVAIHGDLAPGAPIIALSGAAAAVGVTTAACGLARELARLGKQVIIVDANVGQHAGAKELYDMFQLPLRQGEGRGEGKHPYTLANILDGTRRAIEVLIPCENGVKLIAGVPHSAPASLDANAYSRLVTELADLSRQADVVLVDAGHGMTPWINRLWQLARQVFLLATPDNDAVLGAYAAVKLSQHDRLDARLRLVVNNAASDQQAADAAARFGKTCRRFLGLVTQRHTALPADAPREAAPPEDDSPYRRALRLLAADLAGDCRAHAYRIPAPPRPQPANRIAAPAPLRPARPS
jgi:MinD-like ATPase involved in chromosome partitioning or flagellar assembly